VRVFRARRIQKIHSQPWPEALPCC
jgi:hypothetical protein